MFEYSNRLLSNRTGALEKLRDILQSPDYLLDDDLRNDLTLIIDLLTHNAWNWIKIGEENIERLYDAASLAVTLIDQSIKVIKRYKLLDPSILALSSKYGEPPRIIRLEYGFRKRTRYKLYEMLLKRSIEFRDECLIRQYDDYSFE